MTSDYTIGALPARAREQLDRVSPVALAPAVRNGAIVVDVRDSAERIEQGELPGAR